MNQRPKKTTKLDVHHTHKAQGISKGQAALQLLEKRSINQPETSAKRPKHKVKKNEMPFVPELIKMPLNVDGSIPYSALTPDQHRRYNAIISNYLRSDSGFRFELNKFEMQGFDEKMVQERAFYESECLNHFDSQPTNTYNYLSNGARKVFKERMTPRFALIPAEGFQKEVYSIDWPFDDSSTSGRQCRPIVERVLNEGYLPRVLLPNPRRRCRILDDPTSIRKKLPLNENPIEADENAVNFALNNDVPWIMTASTLRSLLVMPWIYRDQNYAFKFSVRQKVHKGRFCRYIVFSKPIVASALSKPALQHQYIKWLLKTSIIKDKVVNTTKKRRMSDMDVDEEEDEPNFKRGKLEDDAMDYVVHSPGKEPNIDDLFDEPTAPESPKQLTIVDNDDSIVKIEEVKTEIMEEEEPASDPSNDLLGNILGQMGEIKKPQKVKEEPKNEQVQTKQANTVPVKVEPPSSIIEDLLGDIMHEMGDSASNNAESNTTDEVLPEFKKRYSIVGLDSEYVSKQKILVRSTNLGVDQDGEQICLTAKADYLPAIGAECVCEEELLWNYFTTTLKSAEILVNVRFHPQSGNVLQIQRFSNKNFYSALSDGNRRLISQRTERLSNLLDQINELPLGEYLLMNVGERMDILSQTIEDPEAKIWNATTIMEAGINAPFLPLNKPSEMWKQVDYRLPLVWHIVLNRAPCALVPNVPGNESNRGGQNNQGRGQSNRGRGQNNRGRGNRNNWRGGRGRGGNQNRS